MKPAIDLDVLNLKLLATLFACHAALYIVMQLLVGDRRIPEKQSPVAMILTYNCMGVCYAALTTVLGFRAWFGAEAQAISGSAHGRLYGLSETMQTIAVLTAVYEVYNTILTIVMPEYRTMEFIAHHATTCVLALCSAYPFLNYYGLFFMGVSSVSTIPLCLIEIFECLEADRVVFVLHRIFAFLFLCVRTCYWPLVSWGFWSDALSALRADTLELQVHNKAVYILFLVANFGLTGLQLVWTGTIIGGIAESAWGEKKSLE